MSTTTSIGLASAYPKLDLDSTFRDFRRIYFEEPAMKLKQEREIERLQKEIQNLQRIDHLIPKSPPQKILKHAPIPDSLSSIVTLPKEEADSLHAELKSFFAQVEKDLTSLESLFSREDQIKEERRHLEKPHSSDLEKQIEDCKEKLSELEQPLQEKRAERDRISNEIGDLCNKLRTDRQNHELKKQKSAKENQRNVVYSEIKVLSDRLQTVNNKKSQLEYELSKYQYLNQRSLESCQKRLESCSNDMRILEERRTQREARMKEIYRILGTHLSQEKIAESINNLTDQVNRLIPK